MSSSPEMCSAAQQGGGGTTSCHHHGYEGYESYEGYRRDYNRPAAQQQQTSLMGPSDHAKQSAPQTQPQPLLHRPRTEDQSDEQKMITHYAVADSDDYRKNGGRSDDASDDDRGPPLPPRPQPPAQPGHCTAQPDSAGLHSGNNNGVRKYVMCCLICGGMSAILGVLFLGVYFLLRSYTSTVGYFETVPTFVPATLLILTGVCVMSLARRRNRYSYLIKVSGACGMVCGLTCVLVTVTTTVLHMGRLQTLRECEYTQKTRTCTCYSVLIESHMEADEGVRFVFDSTPDCGVVHGAIYSCLRGVFGLSVAGILVCVFCCMLVYQLLSHERKKMYWEQLALRCRSLYQQPRAADGPPETAGPPSNVRGPRTPVHQYCRYCEQCRYPPALGVYPWDAIENRFWIPGQSGNFYSPNPGEEAAGAGAAQSNGRARAACGWSWPRMPWSRGDQRYRQTPSSPDSQYGFSNSQSDESAGGGAAQGASGPSGGYSVIGGPPYGPWGPPPPYSDPNSPARRGLLYPHVHCTAMPDSHHHHQPPQVEQVQHCQRVMPSIAVPQERHRQPKFTGKEDYENAHYESATVSDSQTSEGNEQRRNTLPARKTKKRADAASLKGNAAPVPCTSGGSGGGGGEPPCTSEHQVQPKQQTVNATEPTESEVYFADVSSCCNLSVDNYRFYEEDHEQKRHAGAATATDEASIRNANNQTDNEDYLAKRFGKRKPSTRSRLPFPQLNVEDVNFNRRQTSDMAEAGPYTQHGYQSSSSNDFACQQYPSTHFLPPESNCNEPMSAERTDGGFLAPDAQYEVIKEAGQHYGLRNDNRVAYETAEVLFSQSYSHKKGLNLPQL